MARRFERDDISRVPRAKRRRSVNHSESNKSRVISRGRATPAAAIRRPRSEIYSAALTRRKTIPRCTARYMDRPLTRVSRTERDDCTRTTRSDTSLYARAVYHGGWEYWVRGGEAVQRPTLRRTWLLYVIAASRTVARRGFFSAVVASERIHVTFAPRRAMPPDAVLIASTSRIGMLTTFCKERSKGLL